ncbi:TetR family transcriptional regulator [Paraliobacillus quinghaiensis]|uniref:TetR family transcriptional regulator n=1 Tax=Paraliobacillus quinghaiensis TaxID=470815 RepID=A0A917TYH5_9BACI|nr:TetR/AcrR family transcriptional regulator [Paraliobacillus quinghaiensis]GGM42496.1 TetR family transcriptional regulator [Paraliobacillus quinghaiensis]
MVKKEHQLRKQEETKKNILDIARNIIAEDGIKALSIRKITNALDYSPGIIYHYFKDKNEIIETIVDEGYGQILATVKSVERNEVAPEEEIKEVFTSYIKAALESPEYYKAVMLSSEPSILKRTAVLNRGISEQSSSLKVLCENIERGKSDNRYATWDSELTGQIIWTSTFGLIIRLMTERNVSDDQVDRLINHHFQVLLKGLLIREN